MNEHTLGFAGITPPPWEAMVEQARQDKYRLAFSAARVWMIRRGLLDTGRRRIPRHVPALPAAELSIFLRRQAG